MYLRALRHWLQCATVSLVTHICLLFFLSCIVSTILSSFQILVSLIKAQQRSGLEHQRGHYWIAHTRSDLPRLHKHLWIKVMISLCSNQCSQPPPVHYFTVVSGLSVSLPALLISTDLSTADRKDQLNAVKMGVFLLCKLTEVLESDSCRQSIVTAPGKVWMQGAVLPQCILYLWKILPSDEIMAFMSLSDHEILLLCHLVGG